LAKGAQIWQIWLKFQILNLNAKFFLPNFVRQHLLDWQTKFDEIDPRGQFFNSSSWSAKVLAHKIFFSFHQQS
jgi:hypothetical protein